MVSISYNKIATTDLYIDANYESGNGLAGEPINPLFKGGIGNRGGFRPFGSILDKTVKFLILHTTFEDLDWPDYIDVETGIFTYYGDNKKPGSELHKTKRYGNLLLKQIFDELHLNNRGIIPPIFIFSSGLKGRDVIFRGLAVPGTNNSNSNSDLVAIWKSKSGQRFQNYKATFTILNEQIIKKAWIDDLKNSNPLSVNAPKAWLTWRNSGKIEALKAPKAIEYRSKKAQIPLKDSIERKIIEVVYDHFKSDVFLFERFASDIFKLMDNNVISIDNTRKSRDGGRDAIGFYRIGDTHNGITVEFSLEAKCYKLDSCIGVKPLSRLISRLRHRQFGVLVTTSYLDLQAYKEIKEDGHPIIVLAAIDIAKILRENGYSDTHQLKSWLVNNF